MNNFKIAEIKRKALTNFVIKTFRDIDNKLNGLWKVLEHEGIIKKEKSK